MKGFYMQDGYVFLATSEFRASGRRIYKAEHVVIAERAIRKPLPDGARVHHHDGAKANNQNQNLVICEDHAYHALIHQRTRVFKMGGDPDTEKMCSGPCKRLLPKSHFGPSAVEGDGMFGACRDCVKLRNGLMVQRRSEVRRLKRELKGRAR